MRVLQTTDAWENSKGLLTGEKENIAKRAKQEKFCYTAISAKKERKRKLNTIKTNSCFG